MPQIAEQQDVALRARLFRGLSDASRLAIVEAVRPGPRSVGEIVEATGRSQSNVSNHLACLLDCGLLVREQRGRHAFYRLADARVDALLGLADAILAETARGVGDCPRYAQ
jgi:DNA-binding transcriptional ArsR family regulator